MSKESSPTGYLAVFYFPPFKNKKQQQKRKSMIEASASVCLILATAMDFHGRLYQKFLIGVSIQMQNGV